MNDRAIIKALDKLDINQKEFMQVYESFNYTPLSVEEFIFDKEYNFVSEAMPEKVIRYVKDNNLNVDTSALENCINNRKEYDKIDQDIFDRLYSFEYGYTEDEPDLNELYDEQDKLYDSVKRIPIEALKIKQLIKNL